MYKYKVHKFDNLVMQEYHFPNIGDGIPMHKHAKEAEHATIVLDGAILCYGPEKEWKITLSKNDVYDFTIDQQEHEIVAIEPDTKIINIRKFLWPEDVIINEADFEGIVSIKPFYS